MSHILALAGSCVSQSMIKELGINQLYFWPAPWSSKRKINHYCSYFFIRNPFPCVLGRHVQIMSINVSISQTPLPHLSAYVSICPAPSFIVGDNYNWVSSQKSKLQVWRPPGLPSRLSQGIWGKNRHFSMKINPGTHPRKNLKYNGKSIFFIYKYWPKCFNKFF